MDNYKYIVIVLFYFIPAMTSLGQGFKVDSIQSETDLEPRSLFKTPERTSTAAISKVKGEVLNKTPASNLHNSMYGLLNGLHLAQGNGEPGFDGAWLRIRGIGSYNYGNYTVYVDGFQTTTSYIERLVPNEIESISVFKDAAALATFGMQGANGVIWIETKRGELSEQKINLNIKYGIQKPMHIEKPLNSYDYASLYNEAISNDQGFWSPSYSEYDLLDYQDGKGVNTDWYKQVLKHSAPFVSTDLNVKGGSDLAKYFVLFDYTKTNGHYNTITDDRHSNAQLEHINIRSNFDFRLFDFIEGKVDLGGRVEKKRGPAYQGAALWNNLERYPNNIYQAVNDDGSYPGTTVYPDNPLASIKELGYHSNSDRSLQANFSLKQDLGSLLKGLYLNQAVSFSNWTRGTYNVTKNYERMLNGVAQTTDKATNYSIYDDRGTNQWKWIQFNAGIGYEKIIRLNKIKTSLNYMQYERKVDANQNGSSGNHINYAFRNISGRFNYIHDNKYIGELGFAVSGSDNYAKGNRYGFYPTLSAAWIVSNEEFFDKNTINFLKIRASIGKTGYDGVSGPRYPYKQYYDWTGSIPLGNTSIIGPAGYDIAYTANPSIFAEESLKLNIGIDSEIWNSFSVTLDAFLDKRSGIVSQDYNYMSDVYGINPPYTNSGKATTSGIEGGFIYKKLSRDFNYSIGANLSYFRDNVNYMPEIAPASTEAWRTGNSIGSLFGLESIGFYDISDFNEDGTLKSEIPFPTFGEVQPGDIRYMDLNDDNIIDERDILKIGIGDFPKISYSLIGEAQYKLLDFRFLIQGAAKRDLNILNQARNKVVAFENNNTAYEIAKDRWAYYPDQDIDTREIASYPRLSAVTNDNNYKTSSFWVKEGSFLRVRNVELGFNLKKEHLSALKISQARIYLVGVNLFTWSPVLRDYNLDPETLKGYPAIKSYTIGLSVTY